MDFPWEGTSQFLSAIHSKLHSKRLNNLLEQDLSTIAQNEQFSGISREIQMLQELAGKDV
jgi:hypothetical protein